MDVDYHQDVITKSYGYDVITPLAGGHRIENRTVRQEVVNKSSRPAITLFGVIRWDEMIGVNVPYNRN